jgi:L-aminopeptidase/D-esterase-like protein
MGIARVGGVGGCLEEAILDAMIAAESMTGANDAEAIALPLDLVRTALA